MIVALLRLSGKRNLTFIMVLIDEPSPLIVEIQMKLWIEIIEFVLWELYGLLWVTSSFSTHRVVDVLIVEPTFSFSLSVFLLSLYLSFSVIIITILNIRVTPEVIVYCYWYMSYFCWRCVGDFTESDNERWFYIRAVCVVFHVKAVILFCVLANPTELKSVESEINSESDFRSRSSSSPRRNRSRWVWHWHPSSFERVLN